MRCLLATGGTRGDVQSMLSLARSLREGGHQVLLCAPAKFASWIEGYGIPHRSFGADPDEMLAAEKHLPRLRALFAQDVDAQFQVLGEEVEQADVLISGSIVFSAQSLAERRGIRFVPVCLCPGAIPSREHPFPAIASMRLPRWMNRLSWALGGRVYGSMMVPLINAHRRKLGLKPDVSASQHMFSNRALLGSEPLFGAVPADAGFEVVQTGAWFAEEEEDLDPELERFLRTGPPPVYVGFGSNLVQNARATLEELRVGVAEAGPRAVVVMPEGVPSPDAERLHLVRDVPHGKLFPRCSMIVHHGGAGTTAVAARAGRPRWVVAHRGDQHYWGHQVTRLRLGPSSTPRKRFTAPALAEAICSSASDEMSERCRVFARRMLTDGLQRAVALVLAADREP
jgi:vancomycin aglycone glucosyltransferase